MTEQQNKIYDFLKSYGESKKSEIALHCIGYYYTKGMKYFGLILSNMVDKGYIIRTKKGYYSAVVENTDIGLFS